MVQTAVKQLCDALTATSQYIKQTHLCAADGGYSLHKITDQIYGHLNDAVDRLKELYISIYNDKTIAKASSSFASALSLLQKIPQVDVVDQQHIMIANSIALLDNIITFIQQTPIEQKALDNAITDICETIVRDNYLLKQEVKNAK